jgi:hypothetical protein
MRRIKLIAAKVFDSRKYVLLCNVVCWQQEFRAGDWANKERSDVRFESRLPGAKSTCTSHRYR